MVCLGYTNGRMAVRMGVIELGGKFHLRNIKVKLKVKKAGLLKKFSGWILVLGPSSQKEFIC